MDPDKKRRFLPVVTALAVLALAWFVYHRASAITVVFSDGSKAILEKVTFGREHKFQDGYIHFAALERHWPRFLPLLPFSREYRFEVQTDELAPWFSFRDAAYNSVYPSFKMRAEDEHGCLFPCLGFHTRIVARPLATTRLDAYPRSQKRFKMHLIKGTDDVAIMVDNPAVVQPEEWKPAPLPVSTWSGDLKVTLKELNPTTLAPNEVFYIPQWEIEQKGRLAVEWSVYSTNFLDATGNNARSPLCQYTPAIKLCIELRKNEDASFETNELWSLPAMALPVPGQFSTLKGLRKFDAAVVRILALAGPGIIHYSNNIPTGAEVPAPSTIGQDLSVSRWTSFTGEGLEFYESRADEYVFSAKITDLKADQNIIIYGIDDQGIKKTAKTPHHSAGDFRLMALPVDKQSKTIQLNIVVQTLRKMEFVVKPPALPSGMTTKH